MGYCGAISTFLPHKKDVKITEIDVIFLAKKYRKGLAGIKFIKFVEENEKKRGVEVLLQHANVKRDLTNLFERIGYKKMDVSFYKEL